MMEVITITRNKMNTKPDYFIELPTFTIKRRELIKDSISGDDFTRDFAVITPTRLNLADVSWIAYPSYTDPSSMYYNHKTGEMFKQSKITAVSIVNKGGQFNVWCYIPYEEMVAIHDEYLKMAGIQNEVPSYYVKDLNKDE